MNTSILAFQAFEKSNQKEIHHKRIKSSLRTLNEACASKIAHTSGLSQYQVSRRLSELIRNNEIEIVDKKMTEFHKTPVNIYKICNEI